MALFNRLWVIVDADVDRMRSIGRALVHAPSFVLLRQLARTVVSARSLYDAWRRWIVPVAVPHVSLVQTTISKSRLRFVGSIPEPHAASVAFIHFVEGALTELPRLLALERVDDRHERGHPEDDRHRHRAATLVVDHRATATRISRRGELGRRARRARRAASRARRAASRPSSARRARSRRCSTACRCSSSSIAKARSSGRTAPSRGRSATKDATTSWVVRCSTSSSRPRARWSGRGCARPSSEMPELQEVRLREARRANRRHRGVPHAARHVRRQACAHDRRAGRDRAREAPAAAAHRRAHGVDRHARGGRRARGEQPPRLRAQQRRDRHEAARSSRRGDASGSRGARRRARGRRSDPHDRAGSAGALSRRRHRGRSRRRRRRRRIDAGAGAEGDRGASEARLRARAGAAGARHGRAPRPGPLEPARERARVAAGRLTGREPAARRGPPFERRMAPSWRSPTTESAFRPSMPSGSSIRSSRRRRPEAERGSASPSVSAWWRRWEAS